MHNWPHAPAHKSLVKGTYMVTAATYQKVLHFNNPERIQFLHDQLLELAKKYGWELQAWAVFANHYHFIAQSPNNPQNLASFISNLHVETTRYINRLDHLPNRQVWWQYWDTHITFTYSYLPRLKYVMLNPVKHRLVSLASDYPWCSVAWFEKNSPSSFCKAVNSFKIDQLNIYDDF